MVSKKGKDLGLHQEAQSKGHGEIELKILEAKAEDELGWEGDRPSPWTKIAQRQGNLILT